MRILSIHLHNVTKILFFKSDLIRLVHIFNYSQMKKTKMTVSIAWGFQIIKI